MGDIDWDAVFATISPQDGGKNVAAGVVGLGESSGSGGRPPTVLQSQHQHQQQQQQQQHQQDGLNGGVGGLNLENTTSTESGPSRQRRSFTLPANENDYFAHFSRHLYVPESGTTTAHAPTIGDALSALISTGEHRGGVGGGVGGGGGAGGGPPNNSPAGSIRGRGRTPTWQTAQSPQGVYPPSLDRFQSFPQPNQTYPGFATTPRHQHPSHSQPPSAHSTPTIPYSQHQQQQHVHSGSRTSSPAQSHSRSHSRNNTPLHTPNPGGQMTGFTWPSAPPPPPSSALQSPYMHSGGIPGPSANSNVGPQNHDSTSSSSTTTTAAVLPGTPMTALDSEDKRVRNTLASAKFRAKRKQHLTNIQRTIDDLEVSRTDLTRDVDDLRRENGFLREMVQLKYGVDVPSRSQRQSGAGGNDGEQGGNDPSNSGQVVPKKEDDDQQEPDEIDELDDQ